MRIKRLVVALALVASFPVVLRAQETRSATSNPKPVTVSNACYRYDRGGQSLKQIREDAGVSTLVGVSAEILKEAMDLIQELPDSRTVWSCGDDSIVVVDVEKDFSYDKNVERAIRDAGVKNSLAFVIRHRLPIYFNGKWLLDRILFYSRQGNRRKTVGIISLLLFHELSHVRGEDEAAAIKSHEQYLAYLVQGGWISREEASNLANAIRAAERR